ncbi:uncharacterized protein LOC120338001 [Styela clava]
MQQHSLELSFEFATATDTPIGNIPVKPKMTNLLAISIAVLAVAIPSKVESKSCIAPRAHIDIDWTKVQDMLPLYDVIDVPSPIYPMGCWKFINFTETENTITATIENYVAAKSYINKIYYVRQEQTGKYLLNSKDESFFTQIFTEYEEGKHVQNPDEEIKKGVLDHMSAGVSFLTDYENFFILVFRRESDWSAFVKAKTPQINVDQLQLISEALIENGLQSPVMTLKNECAIPYVGGKNQATVVVA